LEGECRCRWRGDEGVVLSGLCWTVMRR
jgi:hypothetical protein